MKRLLLIATACLGFGATALAVPPADGSKTPPIVYIGGVKYYIHTVRSGETLYSIARRYGVSESEILAQNPLAADGLKTDQNLKIPLAEQPEPAPAVEELTPREERKLLRQFLLHTVAAHETLYSISRRYDISVEALLEDNENLDPTHLSIGQVLRVRKKEVGKTSGEESLAQIEEYKDRLNSVPSAGYLYYVVRPGDTLYTLARRNGTTEEEIRRMNDGLEGGLKAGAIIKMPGGEALPAEPQSAVGERPAGGDSTTVAFPEERQRIALRSLHAGDTLHVALLLPAMADNRPNTNYLEFYQGFLMGMGDMRRQGYTATLDLFNTAHDPERLRRIVNDAAFRRADLIVGPVYEDELAPVVRYAEREGIPVVSPLATLQSTQSDVLFQLSPDPETKYGKLLVPLNSGRRIVLIYTESTDKEFEAAIKELLPPGGYTTFRYEKDANVTPLLTDGGDAVLVVLSAKETEVDGVLAALSSARNNLTARSQRMVNYNVVGGSHWNRFTNIDRNLFFRNGVTFVTTYHARRDVALIRDFDKAYITAFGSQPSLYAYRGYDAAMLFTPAMYLNVNDYFDDRRLTPLQTPYRFEQKDDRSNRVNREWVRVIYNKDYTISIE